MGTSLSTTPRGLFLPGTLLPTDSHFQHPVIASSRLLLAPKATGVGSGVPRGASITSLAPGQHPRAASAPLRRSAWIQLTPGFCLGVPGEQVPVRAQLPPPHPHYPPLMPPSPRLSANQRRLGQETTSPR